MKRTVSFILALWMIATVLASFGAVSAAEPIIITNTNPAITTDVGTKVDLAHYSVIFNGEKNATEGVKWTTEDGVSVTEFTPDQKGTTKLIAESGNKKMNVYVVAKEKTETEYVLYVDDFSKYTSLDELKSKGYTLPANCSLQDGTLVLGSKSDSYARVILPGWLGDFGDYSISTDVKMLETTDNGRWFGLVYRIQNANQSSYPYYHMCIRENTTKSNGIEFAERTPQNNWNVAVTASGEIASMKNAFHTVNVIAFEKTIKYSIDGASVLYVNEAVVGKSTGLYTKGTLGFTMNFGKVAIKGIKVTVQDSAPVREAKKLDLINNAHDELNLINQIANVQKVDGAKAIDVISAEKAPGIFMVNVKDVKDIAKLVETCIEKQVLPTFAVDTEDDAQKLIDAMKNAELKDANVISKDAAVLAKVRSGVSTIRTGLIVDIDGTLTSKTANELRLKIRRAPATFCVISSEDASYANVDELQELAVAVWVDVAAKSDSAEFTVEALRAVTAGANGILTDSSAKLTEVINTYLEVNAFTRTPVMIGHRGNPGVAPENTLSGFLKAYENGADVFEVDVEVTKDGEVIIMHDNTINRTTTYTGNKTVGQMTLEEIKAEFILGKDGKPTEEKVPTLREVLVAFRDKDCKIFVEFKGNNGDNIEKTCALLKELDMVDKVDVISFNSTFLRQTVTKNNIPGMATGYLLSVSGSSATAEDALESLFPVLKTVQTYKSSINPAMNIVSDAFLQATTDRGITVWPWTYNASNNNSGFLSGSDGVTTDDMQWITRMVKYLTVAENTDLLIGDSTKISVKSVAYGDMKSVIAADKLIVKVLAGEDCIQIENGTITGTKAGVATVLYGYATKTANGSPYVVYTQPVTVTVSNPPVEEEGTVEGDPSVDVDAPANSTPDTTNEDGGNTVLIVILCVAAAAAVIGVVAVIVVKRKKK